MVAADKSYWNLFIFIICLFQDLYISYIYILNIGVRTKGHNIPYKAQTTYPAPAPQEYIYMPGFMKTVLKNLNPITHISC